MAVRFRNPADSGYQWEKFLDFCNDLAKDNRWFRGVTNKEYALIPKIGRGHEHLSWYDTRIELGSEINLADREKRLFEAFRRRARLGLATLPQSTIEWLSLAQHHGVPTRLLDWTTNPLMAAWFATNSPHAKEDQVATIYSIIVPADELVTEDDIDPFGLFGVEPKYLVAPHWHARVRAQRGCFSIYPYPNQPFEYKRMRRFDIAHIHWAEFRRRLYYFGVDASTVMADLAGLGEALSWQFDQRIGIGTVGY